MPNMKSDIIKALIMLACLIVQIASFACVMINVESLNTLELLLLCFAMGLPVYMNQKIWDF